MFERVLVPLDGSHFSDLALDRAFHLGNHPGREILCVTAIDTRSVLAQTGGFAYSYDPSPMLDVLESSGEAILADARERARAANVTVTTRSVRDTPASAITNVAQECDIDLIIMGTQGRTGFGHLLMGSTTESVLRNCTIPVMTVRTAIADRSDENPFSRILIAIDDSEPADAAIDFAFSLGIHEGARLTFCTVVETDDIGNDAATYGYDPRPVVDEVKILAETRLAHAREKAQVLGLTVDTLVVEGSAETAIAEAASASHALAIVIGSHGRRGLQRFVMGSVAEHVVRTSPIPVLVVRTGRRAVPNANRPRVLTSIA